MDGLELGMDGWCLGGVRYRAPYCANNLMITVAAAPSDSVEAFPAVTVPPSLLKSEQYGKRRIQFKMCT